MTLFGSTPHAHTTYVDGRSTAEEMILSAISRGFRSLGFSEHAIQPFDVKYCLSEQTEPQYIAEIQRLRSQYADQIRVYLGAERDFYSTANRAKYEYVIGSVHYVPKGDEFVAVDGPSGHLERLIEEGYNGDGIQLAQRYFELLAGYVESYRPDIIGHFDLIRKHNRAKRLFDDASADYIEAAKQAMDRMRNTDAILEVNTGAMARGYLSVPYPQINLLTYWRTLGGRVILSSDCHNAELINYGYDEALALIKQAGFTSVWALNPGEGDLLVECELL